MKGSGLQALRFLFLGGGLLLPSALLGQIPYYTNIAAGGYHILATRSDGVALSAGINGCGQLSDATTTNHWYFRGMTNVNGLQLSNAVSMAGGRSNSLVLLADGTVWASGWDNVGQNGDGTTTDRHRANQVTNLNSVVAIDAGYAFGLALTASGTVRGWGNNANGELGDGTTNNRSINVAVTNLTNVVAIAGGQSHSLALCNGGSVLAWGNNANGQLGDGTLTERHTPVLVSNLNSVVAIAAGASNSFALISDGTVRSWGWNNFGQLGDSSTTQRKSNVIVVGLSNVMAIAAGATHSLALLSNQTVVAWGLNSSGQLGDGTTVTRTTNVPVTGLTNVIAIAAGSAHSVALKCDGTIWIWGVTNYATGNISTVPVAMGTAVQILAQPQDQTVNQGSSATFTVTAWGTPLNCQWRFNGTSISGATGSSYTITNAQPSDAGDYSVVITNSSGSVTSGDAALAVIVPPSITVQPVDQIVIQGSNATFSVTATGTTLSYQWQFNGTNIARATASTLIKTNVQPWDTGNYAVVITNAAGSVTSDNAVLSLGTVPVIVRQPDNVTRAANGTVAFRVAVTGTEPLCYQWRFNGASISGATNAVLSFISQPSSSGDYTVVVTNAVGSAVSSPGTLTCYAWAALPDLPDWIMLDAWDFDDTDWLSWNGWSPLVVTNVACVPSWSQSALQVDSDSPAIIQYPSSESYDIWTWPEIVCDSGAIEFWFSPDWSGTNLGGTGPGSAGRLIEVGTQDGTNNWWALCLSADGTRINFSSQSNGIPTNYLSANISWASNEWYFVALAYTASSSALYVDGNLVTNGLGVTQVPDADTLAAGFRIGSDENGTNQARGQFESLITYDAPLPDYQVALDFDADWPTVASWTPPPPQGGMMIGAGANSPNTPSGNSSSYTNGALWLGIAHITNATAYLVVHTPDTNGVYDLFTTTNLSPNVPGLNLTNWLWLTRTQPGQTNLAVALPTASESFFVLGTMLDSDADGLTDAYEGLVSHTDPNNPDTDGDGVSDGDEVLIYHTNPKMPDGAIPSGGLTIQSCPQ